MNKRFTQKNVLEYLEDSLDRYADARKEYDAERNVDGSRFCNITINTLLGVRRYLFGDLPEERWTRR